jgi:hypothetical protein
MPKMEEIANPLGVTEEVGEKAIAVPHLTVGEIDPGSDGAETVNAKRMRFRNGCNGLLLLDSLLHQSYSVT